MKPGPVTHDDVAAALELIAARVPDRHVTPDDVMAAAWFDDVARYNRAALFRAARSWNGLRFPAPAELVPLIQEHSRAIALEEAAAHHDGTLETSACRNGCDAGWLIDRDGTTETVRPCGDCHPIEYAVWLHRLPDDHDEDHCPDCLALRRKKDPPAWYAAAVDGAALRRAPVDRF